MDQVRIRAAVSAGGLTKGAEVTVAATPQVEGAIRNGVYIELNRFKPEDFITPVEDVELPESDPLDVPPFDEPEVIPEKKRGRGNR